MNIYKISCPSNCGSYFSSYLQSVTITADDEETALQVLKDWMTKTGNRFIYPERSVKKDIYKREYVGKNWEVELLAANINNNMIIDTYEDRDY